MSHLSGRRALVLLLSLVAGCSADTAIPSDPPTAPLVLAPGGGGGKTLYVMTLQGGLQSAAAHPFSALAKTGDPFGSPVSGNPVYLSFPAATGGLTATCDADGSGLGVTTASWGAYAGVWKGSFSISGKGGKYHFSFVATREAGGGYLNLVVDGPAVKSNGNLTLTFTNRRGLVAANSTPDGGPTDPQDRCLTFSMTATP